MTRDQLAELAADLRRGECPEPAVVLKRNPVRCVARVEDALLKVYAEPSAGPRREARALAEARRRGVPVPETLGVGADWIATRWLDARPATREDLPRMLPLVERMHAAGMLHGDLHLGNLLVHDGELVLTDLQRARFLTWLPGLLRRRELGFLAFSIGEPLPRELRGARRWRAFRAQRHWRSRTRRCLVESGGFTAFSFRGARGFRRREADPDALERALESLAHAEPLKARRGANLYRSGAWIAKEYPSARAARRAWINARGLEVRGIGCARALCWAGRRLLMEDAGETLIDWVEAHLEKADAATCDELTRALAKLLADLHRRGIYHADLKANNVAWAPGAPPRLLDYGRVRFGWRIGLRRRVKNLAQLNAALPDLVNGEFRRRAFDHYLRESQFGGDASALRRRVVRLSLKRRHRWSGC